MIIAILSFFRRRPARVHTRLMLAGRIILET